MKVKSIIIQFLVFILLFSCVASAEFDGYTQYLSYGVNGNITISLGAEQNISTVSATITNLNPTNILEDGTIVTKAKPITISYTGVDLVDTIHQLNITYDADMQSNFNDTRIGYYDGTLIPYNYYDKSDSNYMKTWIQIPYINDSSDNQLYVFYGNATASSGDDGEATFTEPDNPEQRTALNGYANRYTTTFTGYQLAATHTIQPEYYGNMNLYYAHCYYGAYGGTDYKSAAKITYQIEGSGETTLIEDSSSFSGDQSLGGNVNIDTGIDKYVIIRYYVRVVDDADVAYIHTAQAYADRDTYLPFFSEIDAFSSITYSSSVVGDSDSVSIASGDSDTIYLYPTGNISNLNINSSSDIFYDYDVKVYWTEDTATITESVNNTYALLGIEYIPSENISLGYLNTTFNTIDLTQYTGDATCTINDTPTTCSLTGSNANITLSSLNAGQLYYINVSVPYNLAPVLLSPVNESSDDYSFPPLQHDVTLNWASTYADTYKYEVATDPGFNYIFATDEISANTTDVTLNVPDTYYWRVYGNYDGTYSPASDVGSFTMNATSTATGTGVNGVVYDAANNPISSATVNIYNNTWSGSVLSTSTGYFQFTGLTGGETYFLQASKDGYSTSPVATATVTTDEIYTINLLIQKIDAPNYIYPYYVTFYVTNWFTWYEGVTVSVYEGTSATIVETGVTNSEGAIGFDGLSEGTEYRVTAIDVLQGINIEEYISTTDKKYYLVPSFSWLPDEQLSDNINYSILYNNINLTHGYTNISYSDSSGSFVSSTVNVYDEDLSLLNTYNSAESSHSLNLTLETSNSPYIVELIIYNTDINDNGYIVYKSVVDFAYGVREQFDFGWDAQWKYQLLSAVILIAIGFAFSYISGYIAAFMMVLVDGMFIWMGWMPRETVVLLLATLAGLLAVMYILRKQEVFR